MKINYLLILWKRNIWIKVIAIKNSFNPIIQFSPSHLYYSSGVHTSTIMRIKVAKITCMATNIYVRLVKFQENIVFSSRITIWKNSINFSRFNSFINKIKNYTVYWNS